MWSYVTCPSVSAELGLEVLSDVWMRESEKKGQVIL